jgi:hypothetical protein
MWQNDCSLWTLETNSDIIVVFNTSGTFVLVAYIGATSVASCGGVSGTFRCEISRILGTSWDFLSWTFVSGALIGVISGTLWAIREWTLSLLTDSKGNPQILHKNFLEGTSAPFWSAGSPSSASLLFSRIWWISLSSDLPVDLPSLWSGVGVI